MIKYADDSALIGLLQITDLSWENSYLARTIRPMKQWCPNNQLEICVPKTKDLDKARPDNRTSYVSYGSTVLTLHLSAWLGPSDQKCFLKTLYTIFKCFSYISSYLTLIAPLLFNEVLCVCMMWFVFLALFTLCVGGVKTVFIPLVEKKGSVLSCSILCVIVSTWKSSVM